MAMANTTCYILVHADWLDRAERALESSDGTAALKLLAALTVARRKPTVGADGSVRISTLGLRLGTCAQCEHYDKDPDPIDPGWPMMCGALGIDMLEPYATCWLCCPKEGGDES